MEDFQKMKTPNNNIKVWKENKYILKYSKVLVLSG